MGGKKGLTWTQQQLKVAYELAQGKHWEQVAIDANVSNALAYRVYRRLKEGKEPPSLDPNFIAQAEPSAGFGPQKKTKEKPGGQAPSKEKLPGEPSAKITSDVSAATILKILPKAICPL